MLLDCHCYGHPLVKSDRSSPNKRIYQQGHDGRSRYLPGGHFFAGAKVGHCPKSPDPSKPTANVPSHAFSWLEEIFEHDRVMTFLAERNKTFSKCVIDSRGLIHLCLVFVALLQKVRSTIFRALSCQRRNSSLTKSTATRGCRALCCPFATWANRPLSISRYIKWEVVNRLCKEKTDKKRF